MMDWTRAFPRYAGAAACTMLCALSWTACGGQTSMPAGSPPGSEPQVEATRCSSSVVYVATQHYPASIYIYDQGVHGKHPQPCGQISNVKYPQGLFVDRRGNLWVAVEGDCKTQFSSVLEFAPGGTTPIKRLADPDGVAWDVVVDDDSGTAYVTNVSNFTDKKTCAGSANGVVEVYAHGSTLPTGILTDSRINEAVTDALDDRGNLYVDYLSAASSAGILKWRHGEGTAKDLGVLLPGAGGVQTTATGALAVCDQTECGGLAPGSTKLSDRFGKASGPYAIALDQAETDAWVQVPFGQTQRFKYPGPDRRASESFLPPYGGDLGIAVNPPAPPGKPY